MVPPTDRRAIFRTCVKESQAAETRMRRPSKLGLSTWEPASFQRQALELRKTQWLSLWEYHEPYIGWLADVQLLEGHNCRKRVNKCCSVLATEKMKNTPEIYWTYVNIWASILTMLLYFWLGPQLIPNDCDRQSPVEREVTQPMFSLWLVIQYSQWLLFGLVNPPFYGSTHSKIRIIRVPGLGMYIYIYTYR